MIFKAQFYYKNEPAIDGIIELEAAHAEEAGLKVYLMIRNKDDAIPINWDRFELNER